MKKNIFYSAFLLGSCWILLLLSACSTPDYTQSQLAALYQKQLQSTQTSLQDIFSHISKDTQSSTQLQLTLPSDSIQGTINYQSIKSTKEKAEKNNISLNGNLQDLEKNLPLQFSGNFLTLYTGNQMYLSIQNFSLFMGTGNTEAKFFTLLAQQLANKRIALDQQNTIGINIVEIPTYSEILENIFKLYTPFDATFTPILNTKNEFINKISTLPLEYLTTLTTTIQLISNLAGLEISTENLSLNPEKESTTHYKLSEKNKPEYTSALHLTTDSHTFTFVIGYSKEKEMFTLWLSEIKKHTDEDTLPTQSLLFTFTPKNSTTYTIKALREQNLQTLRNVDAIIKLKPQIPNNLHIEFEGDLTFKPLQLNNQQSLSLHFKGGETLQSTTETDFTLSGEILQLSTLLE